MWDPTLSYEAVGTEEASVQNMAHRLWTGAVVVELKVQCQEPAAA